ncbi:LuxR C-terminal-related transcriptional regulator [Streptomyces sp. ZAF1911]|uniref:ATP-binding protein n=1 Tax=Streptomyces sp. ZAF1911 TaxID=2944129 RepID=UPI00237AC9FC|nr:LuxR C-terminal-related transcriptional regulator [Streptomyces sp. ZAF1911]MDD9375886.1 LuxR C-terminal-related transcriptional regulator [Streptomyces sp. ZAF1911]
MPVELTTFVGRREDITAVKAALSGFRAVTLTGIGGVGKTRLAMRVATDLRRAFADGVSFIDLSAATDRAALDASVIEGLRIHDRSGREAVDIILDFLRERQMLLLLDNCEQIVGECASLIDTVMRRAPRVRILATSRERLWVTGECVWRVPSLPVPDPDFGVGSAQGSPAPVQYPALVLFGERAAAASGASVNREDWPDVARLCRRMDGLPLAIELAAIQTRVFSPGQLVQRYDERLGPMGTLDRTVPDRHRTLEAAIDWSYELCTPHERLLWSRASVFASRFGLDAAEGVCSGEGLPREEVLASLAGLVDKSILVPEEQLGELQYRLLQTLADYGRTRLRTAGAEETLVRRHRDWYLQQTEEMATQWWGPDQLDWSQWLRREYRNLRSAVEYCVTTPGEGQAGLRLTAALLPHWHAGAEASEGRLWLERALAADTEPTLARAMSLRSLASICASRADYAPAEAALRECHIVARHLHDPLMAARAHSAEAELAVNRADYATALASAEQALACPEYAGGPERAQVLSAVIVAHAMLGHYDEAVSAHEEAVRCSVEFGGRSDLVWALVGRAIAEFRAGDHQAVVRYAGECIRIARDYDNAIGLATSYLLLVRSLAAEGDFGRAAELLGARRRICNELGVPTLSEMESLLIEALGTQLEEELGGTSFEAAVARGYAFDLDAAIDYALGTEGDEPERSADAGTAAAEPSPLTAREQQVAGLVARGLSNRKIAEELVISPRTVEGHVDHILTKLGFTSRAQIAAWAARQGG